MSFMSEKLLEPLEPGNLSTPNLRRMLTRGRAEVNKSVLQRILEFGTGISTDMPLVGHLRDITELQNYCKKRYIARGRRCMDLPMPPVWERDGLFQICGLTPDGGALMILDRLGKKTFMIPKAQLPMFTDVSQLTVEFNWSEVRACIRSAMDRDHENDFVLQSVGRSVLAHGGGAPALEDIQPNISPTKNLLGVMAIADAPTDQAASSRAAPSVGSSTTPSKRPRLSVQSPPTTGAAQTSTAARSSAAASASAPQRSVAPHPKLAQLSAADGEDGFGYDDEEGSDAEQDIMEKSNMDMCEQVEVDESLIVPPPPSVS